MVSCVRVSGGFVLLGLALGSESAEIPDEMFGGPNPYEGGKGGTYERKKVKGCKEQRMSFRKRYTRGSYLPWL